MGTVHLVARAEAGWLDLGDPQTAGRVWRALRRGFPEALAAVLMPDHLHLVTPGTPVAGQQEIGRVLGTVAARVAGARGQDEDASEAWAAITPGDPLQGLLLVRTVRYLSLNPCRGGLANDPLAWRWSTHRDVVGAVADPWVTAERLAPALGEPEGGFAASFHRYVSSDYSVEPAGTPMPSPAPVMGREPMKRLSIAVAEAMRVEVGELPLHPRARRVLAVLASRQGRLRDGELGRACGVSARAVRRMFASPRIRPAALAAAILCLGDDRLTFPVDPQAPLRAIQTDRQAG
jgi:REP element-mobilizing transposase RayT